MEKTATADARVTRVSRKLNESTRVYLALFCLALEERTKRKTGKIHTLKESNCKKKPDDKRKQERIYAFR